MVDDSRKYMALGVWSLQRRGSNLTKCQLFHDHHLSRLNYMTCRNSNPSCSTSVTLTCILSIFLWMYSVNVLVTGRKQCPREKCFLASYRHNLFYYIIVKCFYRHFSVRKIPPLMQFKKILFAFKEANKCRHSTFLAFNWVPMMCPD